MESLLLNQTYEFINIHDFIESYNDILPECGEIIQSYLDEYPTIQSNIIIYNNKSSLKTLAKECHSLKGISSSMYPNEILLKLLKESQINALNNQTISSENLELINNYLEKIKKDINIILKIINGKQT